jgi:hypothetical protein
MRMWDVVWDQFSSSGMGTRPVILTPTTLCTLTTT